MCRVNEHFGQFGSGLAKLATPNSGTSTTCIFTRVSRMIEPSKIALAGGQKRGKIHGVDWSLGEHKKVVLRLYER